MQHHAVHGVLVAQLENLADENGRAVIVGTDQVVLRHPQHRILRIDEQGKEEWVRCGPGDTLVAPINALHAFHNRTDKPSRFLSSSVYYHEVALDRYGLRVDVNDPLPPNGTPSEAEAEQYLGVLKDALGVHMYFPQANAHNGLEVFRAPARYAGAGEIDMGSFLCSGGSCE